MLYEMILYTPDKKSLYQNKPLAPLTFSITDTLMECLQLDSHLFCAEGSSIAIKKIPQHEKIILTSSSPGNSVFLGPIKSLTYGIKQEIIFGNNNIRQFGIFSPRSNEMELLLDEKVVGVTGLILNLDPTRYRMLLTQVSERIPVQELLPWQEVFLMEGVADFWTGKILKDEKIPHLLDKGFERFSGWVSGSKKDIRKQKTIAEFIQRQTGIRNKTRNSYELANDLLGGYIREYCSNAGACEA